MAGAAEVTDLADEAEDTFLPVVAATHLADSPAAALVLDSAEHGDFLMVAEIMAVSVTVLSVDGIATFAVVVFAILMGTSSISTSTGSDIRIITSTTTRIATHIPISDQRSTLKGRVILGTTERLNHGRA